MTDSVFAAVRYGADAACARDALDNALRQARAEALREAVECVGHITQSEDRDAILALIEKEG